MKQNTLKGFCKKHKKWLMMAGGGSIILGGMAFIRSKHKKNDEVKNDEVTITMNMSDFLKAVIGDDVVLPEWATEKTK